MCEVHRKETMRGAPVGAPRIALTDGAAAMATICLWTGKAVFARIFGHDAAA
jgi:hypothetical protein